MTPDFTLFVVFTTIAIVGIALMVWHNDRIVVLEDCFYDWLCDRIGYVIAKIILFYHRYRVEKVLKSIDKTLRKLEKEESVIEKMRCGKQ